MGTSNFYYKNASKVYAICMGYEAPVLDDDGEETEEMGYRQPDEFEVNCTLENIQERMSENKKYSFCPLDEWDNARNFPSRKIGEWYKVKEYAGIPVEVHIVAKATSGYYEGACLDYDVETYFNGDEVDELQASDFIDRDVSEFRANVLVHHANNWLQKTRNKIADDIEKLFEEVCEVKLRKVATFSNGETIYEKA